MPSRSLLRAFVALWLVTGTVLLVASIATVQEAWAGSRHINPHLATLGGLEAVAALLFMLPRTLRAGAIALLVTIAVAFMTHIVLGQFRGDLLLYGTAVAFVLVHGPLTPMQWRAAIRHPLR